MTSNPPTIILNVRCFPDVGETESSLSCSQKVLYDRLESSKNILPGVTNYLLSPVAFVIEIAKELLTKEVLSILKYDEIRKYALFAVLVGLLR